jgi:uncharacterized protein (DUF779 family)
MAEAMVATAAAVKLIQELRQEHGPLMFHQSGGCCDGSVPLCFRLGEFRVGSRDVLFGTVEDTPFYVGHAQAEYLSRTQLVLDVIPGDIDSFSLEAGTGGAVSVPIEGLRCRDNEGAGRGSCHSLKSEGRRGFGRIEQWLS